MAFETIVTKRLLVRRLVPQDAETISIYRSLPEVSKFQSVFSLEKASDLIKEMENSDPTIKGRWFQFGIELKSTGELIGDIGFFNTDEKGKCWVGFTLNPKFWGNGYAVESVLAILDYYSRFGISIVWASTDPANGPSQKLLKRIGFILRESTPNDVTFSKQLN